MLLDGLFPRRGAVCAAARAIADWESSICKRCVRARDARWHLRNVSVGRKTSIAQVNERVQPEK